MSAHISLVVCARISTTPGPADTLGRQCFTGISTAYDLTALAHFLFRFASWVVDSIIMVSIVVLLVELQLELSGENINSEVTFENHASEYVLFSVLWVEFLCRLYALGPKAYWRYNWHKYDEHVSCLLDSLD